MSTIVDVAYATPGAYQARRSNKTNNTKVMSDGAIWKERLAVCESVTDEGNPKLTIRSYYRNQVTQERVWDEPPSGASEVIFASSEQRKKADRQKQEMQLTLDEIPPDMMIHSQQSNASSERSKKHGQPHNNNNASNNSNSSTKGGIFGRLRKTKERPSLQDDAKDLNLQRAIALSVAEANGKTPYATDPVILYDNEAMPRTEEEEVALAKALSMSQTQQRRPLTPERLQPAGLTEEELLQQALEASRLEPNRVPSFDPYAPGSPSTTSRSSRRASHNIEPPHKMESDEGKKKPGRSMKRRVFGGRKTIATKAGVV